LLPKLLEPLVPKTVLDHVSKRVVKAGSSEVFTKLSLRMLKTVTQIFWPTWLALTLLKLKRKSHRNLRRILRMNLLWMVWMTQLLMLSQPLDSTSF
jgi:hypothetical protein